jgi:segregation and condensation protein A
MQAHSGRDNTRGQNEDGSSVGSCRVQLDIFEGPLDLLLYLIRKEEIDIYDIPVARVTEQYLRYLDMMRVLDLSFAGEFLAMAATLLFIKSKMLLPPEERTEEVEEQVEDPRAELVRQLFEYRQFKEVADDLEEKEAVHHRTFQRYDTSILASGMAERPLGDVGIFDLLTAFSEVLERAGKEERVHEVEEEEVTVPDQMQMILRKLKEQKEILFHLLFPEGAGRMTIIATFLALLELIRLKKVVAVQELPFAEIRIRRR